ncbi:hypothetical protein RCL_jg3904.t1 [Rhizophagus clarus]|uniref:Uncharacterized protein n=1 Tax=Rhizophagus clarus TaxID=94130 RepID=A0A8H3QB87_9GLOM|nr:hypothetical protein RCL_jg3904.t1 [Rhizophagus clarus]
MLSFCKVEDQEGRESAFFVYFSALIKHFSALSTSTNSVGGVWAVVKGEVHLQKIYEKIILLVIEDKNAGIPNLRKKVAEDERIAHNNPQLFSLQIENQIDLSLLDSEIPHIMIDINCTDRALILIRVVRGIRPVILWHDRFLSFSQLDQKMARVFIHDQRVL